MTTIFKTSLIILLLLVSKMSVADEPITLLSRANAPSDGFLNSDETFNRLLSHAFTTKLQWTNQARLIKRLTTNEPVCSYDLIKTPEREQHIIFSELPTTVYEQRKVYAFKSFLDNLPKRVSVLELLEKNHTLGIDSGTSYKELEPILEKYKDQIASISSEDTSSQLPNLLIHNRIDMIIDYEINIQETFSDEQLKKIGSRAIAEYPEYVNGYFACSKTSQGNKVIQALNHLMKSPAIYNYLRQQPQHSYSADTSSGIMLANKQMFVIPPKISKINRQDK